MLLDLTEKTAVFSDGRRMALAMSSGGGVHVILFDYVLRDLSVGIKRDLIETSTMGGYTEFIAGHSSADINLGLTSIGEVVYGGEELLKELVPVGSLSIEGLFKVIQGRIKERDPLLAKKP